ncbi:hypothetical protein CAEBREN_04272 [Caenorhabditis brenneri]|uniref:Uncharacterized protein n=1 Tax=Caenorhabditis brenneri TaxID=135651 RepID=G0MCT1_CAEBE|nr:hypothetical protein CAEBREN_04272 [Caenorhabditis brenneri]
MAARSDVDPWKALLHMSTSLTVGDPPEEATTTFSPENLEFLRNALLGEHNNEGGPNIIQQFFNVGLMEPSKLVDEPSFVDAAKDLADQLEDFFVMGNFAQQFSEECGFRAMTNLTSSTDTDIQLLYLRLIPLIAENRPEYQTVMAKSELFAHLLQLLPKQNVDAKTKQAIVSAISSCVRSCPTAWEKLFDLGGVEKIQKVLEEEESHVVVAKAAHFLLACHETLIDPVLPAINHRKELEASILHAYAALLRRVPEMKKVATEQEVQFAVATRNSLIHKLTKFPEKEMDIEAKRALHTAICDLNRGCVKTPVSTEEGGQEHQKLIRDIVAIHYKVPLLYTVEEYLEKMIEEGKVEVPKK